MNTYMCTSTPALTCNYIYTYVLTYMIHLPLTHRTHANMHTYIIHACTCTSIHDPHTLHKIHADKSTTYTYMHRYIHPRNTLQRTATHCNPLQHTITLQHIHVPHALPQPTTGRQQTVGLIDQVVTSLFLKRALHTDASVCGALKETSFPQALDNMELTHHIE